MYSTFKAAEGIITYTILSQKLDPSRLAIATAHHAAVKAPWKHNVDPNVPLPTDQTQYLNHVTTFCNQYLSKQGSELLLPLKSFTLPMGFYIENFDLVVQDLSYKYALHLVGPIYLPTRMELAKVSKAFYILDMVVHLFPRSPVALHERHGSDPLEHDKAFNKFWSCFAP
ncbi:hypothetical protein GQX73_g5867 [Xylaria multiplex]|uniref:Uncharacterized protein n=1 Tax=Xylaria multiplex TaxID=323545 RepID=A0A7C8INN2_9PEZI|nr:hypothetical protein GQX73_g5867 [Xylaria multiplex]